MHLEVLVVGLTDDTLLLGVTHVGRVCGILRTAVDVQVVIVLEARFTCHSLQPVGVVAQIFLSGLTIDDVMGIHKVEFLAPGRERNIAVV